LDGKACSEIEKSVGTLLSTNGERYNPLSWGLKNCGKKNARARVEVPILLTRHLSSFPSVAVALAINVRQFGLVGVTSGREWGGASKIKCPLRLREKSSNGRSEPAEESKAPGEVIGGRGDSM